MTASNLLLFAAAELVLCFIPGPAVLLVVSQAMKLGVHDFLDKPITQGGELARFRVESRVPLDVVVNQAPHIRLAFDDGLNYDWHPFELIEWVSETVANFAVVFKP